MHALKGPVPVAHRRRVAFRCCVRRRPDSEPDRAARQCALPVQVGRCGQHDVKC